MSCEPLRGKKLYSSGNGYEFYLHKDVKSAVEFYKKYRDDGAWKLEKEQPKIYNKWVEDFGEIDEEDIWDFDDFEGYNNWLFDYCFGDVTE